jgi:non-ribosomal peptide synthetase component F
LVFDLDNNGVELSTTTAVTFDIAATGEPARIDALTGSDALLALDIDGNGTIDSGAELFGNSTACDTHRCADGVDALRQHDSDESGRIDSGDPVFERLLLWRDLDGDGQSKGVELTNLQSAGIVAIDLSARLDLAWTDARGNSAMRAVTFERRDGSTGLAHDVWFALSFDALPRNPLSAGLVTRR